MIHSKEIEQINQTTQMQEKARGIHKTGKTIGLVPTMGYFHQGHLSLMKTAKEETDYVVVSLFVNPTQFGPSEDFDRYPRDLKRDMELAKQVGIDIIFCPIIDEMYPPGFLTHVKVEGLAETLCGASRSGHFQGVTTVVCKLFNIISPDFAYFGQKDAQQAIIIKKMVEDLNFHINIRVLPIVREKDGLAMSSRNIYLSGRERKAALCLYKAIQQAKTMFNNGEREAKTLIDQANAIINDEPLATLDYLEVCHIKDLSPLEKIVDKALMALAVKIGKTRLIDNTILKIK
jgi:pantoate--beta-alanine ligase